MKPSIFITGAAAGIGRATAALFCAAAEAAASPVEPLDPAAVFRILKPMKYTCAGALLCCCIDVFAADPISQSYDATLEANRKARDSQQTINKLDDQTRAALEKYRSVLWQAQQQAVYARQLEQIAATQAAEKASLEKQFSGMDDTEREILPLMLRMLDSLEKFVVLDLPFLKSERAERIASLKRLMADASTGIAEKYRRIAEAYQIEIEYGRTLGAERLELPAGGTAKIVDVLRVGRTALYFLSIDGEDAGRWDPAAKTWKPLDAADRRAVRKGLKMAREQTAADLLVLTVPVAAGDAQ